MTQIYLGGALDTWAGAGSFGQRRLVGLTVFFVLGLATIIAATRQRPAKYAAYTLIALAVWWNIGLMAQFGAGLMNRQRLDPVRNAYHNFVTIPREVPALAYRFLLDRASFYQQPPP
jgi:ABC-type amino acid transport system permease subunit